jgi:hypothetical protein
MSPRPAIFVSAVSRELRSARQLAANTLTFLVYDPEWQDIFGTGDGDFCGRCCAGGSTSAKESCTWSANLTELNLLAMKWRDRIAQGFSPGYGPPRNSP